MIFVKISLDIVILDTHTRNKNPHLLSQHLGFICQIMAAAQHFESNMRFDYRANSTPCFEWV